MARGLHSSSHGSLHGFLGPLHSTVIAPIVRIPRRQVEMEGMFMTLLCLKQSQWLSQVQREETYTFWVVARVLKSMWIRDTIVIVFKKSQPATVTKVPGHYT